MSWEAKILHRDDFNLSILFKNVPLHILSSIRRAIIQEVPTIAIDTLYILENNSVLHDEILAHRLGMVPFKSEKALEKYKPPEECTEGIDREKCYSRLYLEVRNNDKDELPVYSGDLRSEDPDIEPVSPRIPLVVLGKGQSVVLEAEVRLGRGKEHIKWSPVTISVLTSVPKLTRIKDEKISEDCRKCIEHFDKSILDQLDKKVEIEIYNLKPTGLLRYCVEKKCGETLKLTYSDKKRILTIESTGSMDPIKIVYEAIKELSKKIEKIDTELDKAIVGER